MSLVKEILNRKGHDVATVGPQESVMEAVRRMHEHNIGGMLVVENGAVVGIFSERDLLNRIVFKGLDPEKTPVSQVMSSPVAYVNPETEIAECRMAMTQKRIRHLPVIQEGKLVGVISIGDIVAWELAEQQTTIKYLNQYIYGR